MTRRFPVGASSEPQPPHFSGAVVAADIVVTRAVQGGERGRVQGSRGVGGGEGEGRVRGGGEKGGSEFRELSQTRPPIRCI